VRAIGLQNPDRYNLPMNASDTECLLRRQTRPLKVATAICMLGLTLTGGAAQAAPVLKSPPTGSAAATTPARAAYEQALSALATGDSTAAEKSFREAIRLDSKFAAPFLGMAELAFAGKRLDEAASWIEQAVKAQPADAHVQASYGRLLVLRKKLPEAEAAFRRAIAADPRLVRPRVDLADVLAARGDLGKAAVQYEEVVAIDPQHAGARFGLGEVLLRQGKPDAAVAAFKRARDQFPDNPMPRLGLARAELARKNADEAMAEVDKVLKAQPSLVEASLLRAEILDVKGQQAAAVAAFEEVAKVAPQATIPHLRIGMIEQQRGNADAAVRAYLKVLAIEPKHATALNNLAALAVERKQDLKQAEAWAQKAVAAVPQAAQFHDTLGTVQRAQGNLPAAIKTFETATRLSPRDPTLKFHLGRALAEKSDKAQARKVLQEALALSPSFPEAAEARQLLASL
jgi:tetratricopeptide (TPR) repeat protein